MLHPLLFMPIFNVTDANVQQAAEIIIKGGLVGIPTETVYGLAANCFDKDACAKIFETKRRPPTDPLIVHISDIKQLSDVSIIKQYQKHIFDILIKHFWPGPMTVILQRNQAIPLLCTAGGETVGVRFPRHLIAQRLIQMVGLPLAAPSANLFGHISPVTAEHVQADFPNLFILEGGSCDIGLESTVLEIKENNEIFIYRRGGISEEMIQKAMQAEGVVVQIISRQISSSNVDKAQIAPGTNLTHYAPNNCKSIFIVKNKAILELFFSKNSDNHFIDTLESNKIAFDSLIEENRSQSIAVINCSPQFNMQELQERSTSKIDIYNLLENPHQKFFYTLHQVESTQVNLLLIIPPLYDGKYYQFGACLFDRIYRCCSGKYTIFPEK